MQLKTSKWKQIFRTTHDKKVTCISLMNGYKCIDMRNYILHANIITTCLRQYLFTIGVGPTGMVFRGITFLTTLAAH